MQPMQIQQLAQITANIWWPFTGVTDTSARPIKPSRPLPAVRIHRSQISDPCAADILYIRAVKSARVSYCATGMRLYSGASVRGLSNRTASSFLYCQQAIFHQKASLCTDASSAHVADICFLGFFLDPVGWVSSCHPLPRPETGLDEPHLNLETSAECFHKGGSGGLT